MGKWRTKIHTDDGAIRAAYEAGETIASIAHLMGLGFGTVQRRLVSSGASLRKNSWNKFDHLFPEMKRMYLDNKMSVKMIGLSLGANAATVLRYLKMNGVAVRADSSVQVYEHNSPCAGIVLLRGTWEACYAKVLDSWFNSGRILGWMYEPERIDTSRFGAGNHYRPDFKVYPKQGLPFSTRLRAICVSTAHENWKPFGIRGSRSC